MEAMGERQITVGRKTYILPELFLVMATQNPIEQEGTYPLPEAQLDRFLMYVKVDYPHAKTEQKILRLAQEEARTGLTTQVSPHPLITSKTIFSIRAEILKLHMSPPLEEYLIQLVIASRNPAPYGDDLKKWISFGASPRATIALDRCARAHAWLHNRDYVSPEDIHAIAHDVLRHRILLSFPAEAEGISSDDCVDELIGRVAIP